MHEDFHMKVGDTRPYLRGVCKDENDAVVDLSNPAPNAMLFSMEARDSAAVKVDRESANIVDAANGVVEYRWNTDGSETDEEGYFFGEFIADWDGAGDETTFPNDGFIVIKFTEQVE